MTNIYLSGSSGQGKTTTALLLSRIRNMEIIDGLSRNSPHKMGTDEHQIYLSQVVYSAVRNTDNSIHCRTPFDVFAYSQVFERGSWSLDESHCDRFALEKPTIFYFPYWLKSEDDGFRPTDDKLVRQVDEAIRLTLEDYEDITVVEVDPGTPHQRVQKIQEYLMWL